MEKAAYKAMRQVLELEEKLLQDWNNQLFEQRFVPAVNKEAQLIAKHDSYAQWLGHVYDAFELVDRRSGDIREPETNAWLLEQVLRG